MTAEKGAQAQGAERCGSSEQDWVVEGDMGAGRSQVRSLLRATGVRRRAGQGVG